MMNGVVAENLEIYNLWMKVEKNLSSSWIIFSEKNSFKVRDIVGVVWEKLGIIDNFLFSFFNNNLGGSYFLRLIILIDSNCFIFKILKW